MRRRVPYWARRERRRWAGAPSYPYCSTRGCGYETLRLPEVHALAHAINATLGNVGKTVVYTDPIEVNPTDQLADFKALMADLDAGAVEILVIIGVNPVYDAPADLDFENKYQKARMRVHCGHYQDETAQYCQWHIPMSHPLEMWGDARAYDGTVSHHPAADRAAVSEPFDV